MRVECGPLEAIESEAVVVLAFEGRRDDRLGAYADLYDAGEITGKPLEMTLLHHPAGMRARRVLLVGAGKPEAFTPAELRKAAGAALRHLKSRSVREFALYLDAGCGTAQHVSAAVEGALLGDWEPDRFKTERENPKKVERFRIAAVAGGAELEEAARRGQIVADGQNLARDLANEPANRLSPTSLAERAAQMADGQGLECEVLDRDQMRQLGMGALLGVAAGSAEPPALIVLRYRPEGAAEAGGAHLGFVGKGVTFDSGGISLKPAEGMERMKYDMSGGAAAIGAMYALAQLKPPVPVTAVIPAVENMTGGSAQRPGDIVTALSGKTIEVVNTDAEGRLILADALTYARRLGCTHLVDAATLTGSIVVALGHVRIGVFGSDEALLQRVLRAAEAAGEKAWPMPLDDEYKEYLKNPYADLSNVGGRWGGAVTAAMFLKQFAEATPWAHMDIAGTASLADAKPFMAKGAAGVPVRTFVTLAMNWDD